MTKRGYEEYIEKMEHDSNTLCNMRAVCAHLIGMVQGVTMMGQGAYDKYLLSRIVVQLESVIEDIDDVQGPHVDRMTIAYNRHLKRQLMRKAKELEAGQFSITLSMPWDGQ